MLTGQVIGKTDKSSQSMEVPAVEEAGWAAAEAEEAADWAEADLAAADWAAADSEAEGWAVAGLAQSKTGPVAQSTRQNSTASARKASVSSSTCS